MFKKLQKIMF